MRWEFQALRMWLTGDAVSCFGRRFRQPCAKHTVVVLVLWRMDEAAAHLNRDSGRGGGGALRSNGISGWGTVYDETSSDETPYHLLYGLFPYNP